MIENMIRKGHIRAPLIINNNLCKLLTKAKYHTLFMIRPQWHEVKNARSDKTPKTIDKVLPRPDVKVAQ